MAAHAHTYIPSHILSSSSSRLKKEWEKEGEKVKEKKLGIELP
jgi:hypothetical protein